MKRKRRIKYRKKRGKLFKLILSLLNEKHIKTITTIFITAASSAFGVALSNGDGASEKAPIKNKLGKSMRMNNK